MTRRAVITEMGGMTAFGEDQQGASTRLLAHGNAVYRMPGWQVYDGLHTLFGAPVDDFMLPGRHIRKHIRAMGRVSQVSTRVSKPALEQVGLIGGPMLTSGETGIAHGPSTGSIGPVSEFATMLTEKRTNNITSTTHVQVMLRTTAVNTGLFFGLHERVISTSNARTSDSQVVGYAWGTIRHGYQTVTVTGGTEELYPSEATVFNTLFAIGQHSNAPKTIPPPFSEDRGRLAIGEGAGTLILEGLERVKTYGVTIYDKIVGLAVSCDATHIIQPRRETIQYCMEQSLKIIGLSAQNIGYTSVHGVATDCGDMAESLTITTTYGDNMPISSLRSYFGHTPGACGALEAWVSL